MNLLIGIIVAIVLIGVLLWAITKLLAAFAIPEPFKTLIYVVSVLIAVVVFLQISGLYPLTLHNL